MIFSVFIGTKNNIQRWQEAFRQFACWMHLNEYFKHYSVNNDSRELAIALASPGLVASNLLENTASGDLPVEIIKNTLNSIGFMFRLFPKYEIKFTVPVTAVEQLYYSNGNQDYVFSNDLRFHIQYCGLKIDERGMFSLLKYLTIPAPLTISENVHRVPGGHTVTLACNKMEMHPNAVYESYNEKNSGASTEKFFSLLDRDLVQSRLSSVLCFSGGVDSSIIAAHVAQTKRKDIKLLNYIFSKQDKEGEIALKIADDLNLECDQVICDLSKVPEFLDNIGQEYSFLFGDKSVFFAFQLITNLLNQPAFEGDVIDGTGADELTNDTFQYKKFSYLYAVPYPIRWIMGQLYSICNLYNTASHTAFIAGKSRFSLNTPLLLSNSRVGVSLDGIAYNTPKMTNQSVNEIFISAVQTFGNKMKVEDQLTIWDLLMESAPIHAAKIFDPLKKRGIKCIYPFLNPDLISLAFKLSWNQKYGNNQEKYMFKKHLESFIKPDLIYRKKAGFSPVHELILADRKTLGHIKDIVLSADNPVINYIDKKFFIRSIESAKHNFGMSKALYEYLWMVAFSSCWLRQINIPK